MSTTEQVEAGAIDAFGRTADPTHLLVLADRCAEDGRPAKLWLEAVLRGLASDAARHDAAAWFVRNWPLAGEFGRSHWPAPAGLWTEAEWRESGDAYRLRRAAVLSHAEGWMFANASRLMLTWAESWAEGEFDHHYDLILQAYLYTGHAFQVSRLHLGRRPARTTQTYVVPTVPALMDDCPPPQRFAEATAALSLADSMSGADLGWGWTRPPYLFGPHPPAPKPKPVHAAALMRRLYGRMWAVLPTEPARESATITPRGENWCMAFEQLGDGSAHETGVLYKWFMRHSTAAGHVSVNGNRTPPVGSDERTLLESMAKSGVHGRVIFAAPVGSQATRARKLQSRTPNQ